MQAPKDQRVKAGGNATFRCLASGEPKPHITWRNNGNNISEAQKRYLITEFQGGSLLRIKPARKERKEINLECVAENGVGDAVFAKARLDVLDDKELTPGIPQIKQHPPLMMVVTAGRNFIIVCKATGDPQPNIDWVKNTHRAQTKAQSQILHSQAR
jgi:hypothetical protein